MPKLVFFSRVALLCNICFLITYLMHYIPALENGIITSTIIILGNIVSIVINILINGLYMLIILLGKPVMQFVPKWIIIINFLFLIVQVILLIR